MPTTLAAKGPAYHLLSYSHPIPPCAGVYVAGTDGSIPDQAIAAYSRTHPTADTELHPYPSAKYRNVPPGGKVSGNPTYPLNFI